MSDILNQSDIDALLNSVADDVVEEEPLEAQIFTRHRQDLENVEIRDYDFRRPERISKDQMRSLHTLHDAFSRNLGASLSGFLRTIVEVRVANVEQMTYAEYTGGLPNPTCFNLVEADVLDGQMCLEVSPLIIYPIIDRLLGGSNQDLFIPQRPMTLIEQRLMQRILDRAMDALSEAWSSVREMKFSLGEMESNPQIMQIVPPNEVVVVLGFEIKMTNRAGTMGLCIPFNVIEPVVEGLSAQSWFVNEKATSEVDWEDVVADRIGEAGLDLRAILAKTSITISELRALEVGDLLMTERATSSPVVISASGHPKFLARLGQHRGKRALRIERSVEPGEHPR